MDFRVWAPRRTRVDVVVDTRGRVVAHGDATTLLAEGKGYFSGIVAGAGAGTRYGFRLDGSEKLYPDPASRFQPEGPHGLSEVVDPAAFAWSDGAWKGLPRQGQVLYEMHVGTFTPEGTFAAAIDELVTLRDVGITTIEMMPIADFPGAFGWGYDGVNLFAPTRLYGRPDDLRQFVDAAHRVGLAVILDVVYNHLGPDGNYLGEFCAEYRSPTHVSEWGDTPNFDGPGSEGVRELVQANADYWIREYHFDGLRLDATQQIFDTSPEHIIAAVARRAAQAAPARSIYVIAENEPQDVRLLELPEQGGCGLDALWNDDFHHAAVVAMTGRHEAYYSDYRGRPQEFVAAAKYGFLYQGQRYSWQLNARGTPALHFLPDRFVAFLENHDQVANTADGRRLHQLTAPGVYRAMTALLLLAPQTPLLFQGQEFASTAPFHFFAHHEGELREQVGRGRAVFLEQFPSLATRDVQQRLRDPADTDTFTRCKLDHSERAAHGWAVALHRDLLRLRREDPVLCRAHTHRPDGAVMAEHAFVLRFFGEGGDDRLLLVNLGGDVEVTPAPEPLLAPPRGRCWQLRWSSEHPCYGGRGALDPSARGRWCLPGQSAALLKLNPPQESPCG